jgi:hypothetical protein
MSESDPSPLMLKVLLALASSTNVPSVLSFWFYLVTVVSLLAILLHPRP